MRIFGWVFLGESFDDDSNVSPIDFFICSDNLFYDGTNSSYVSSHVDSLEDHSFILTVFSYNVSDDNVSNVSSCNSDDDSSDVYDFYFLIFSQSLRN